MSTTSTTNKRVLSIQSHVVSGYVGNKAAVFPLQLLGYDVDIINSVQFSNHTGYSEGYKGDILNGDQLRSLVLDGMASNGLLQNIGYLLTGYIGSTSFLLAVLDVLTTLRQQTTSTIQIQFVCDPVLGDNGKFYVPTELVDIYRNRVVPLANVVTPNQFEIEQLTQTTVTTVDDAKRACQSLLSMGPTLIFITSAILIDIDDGEQKDHDTTKKNTTIAVIAAQRNNNNDDEFWRMDVPLYPGTFTGTGDLTASLLLAHSTSIPTSSIQTIMEQVINTVHAVVRRTHDHAAAANTTHTTTFARELQLIASKRDIENPPQLLHAYPI